MQVIHTNIFNSFSENNYFNQYLPYYYLNNNIPISKCHNNDKDKEDPYSVPMHNDRYMTSIEKEWREAIKQYPIQKE